MSKNNDAPSIENQLSELRALVAWFDSDDFVVEQAVEQFKQAEALATTLKHDLNTMKNEISVLEQRFDEQ